MFGPSFRVFKIFALVLMTLVFYTVARVEFLAWNWSQISSHSGSDILWALIAGWRFDVASVLTLASPLLLLSFFPWPRSWNKVWLLVTGLGFALLQVPFLVLNLVDTEFYNFVGRRFTFDGLFIVNEVPGKFFNFVVSYWPLFLLNTIILLVFLFCVFKVVRWQPQGIFWSDQRPRSERKKLWLKQGLICFLAIAVAVIGIRGGLQKKVVKFVNANLFTSPVLNNVVLNSSFTLIKSYGAKSLRLDTYFSDPEEMLSHLNGSLKPSKMEGLRPKTPQNIVVIILEGFGEEYYGNREGKTYTPFLDSLMEKSLSFKNSYANGRRSIEGIASIFVGIPALMDEPFISSHFTSNKLHGLGTLLSGKGYQTSFFHGGYNGTMYFDSFMPSVGVNQYFGATEYSNSQDDDGVWGIWDEPFLQWMITRIDSEKTPFMSSVFTLTSHQPYKVPPAKAADFPEGPVEILKTVSYTDMALKKFFAEAEKKPWFKDTLFVITGDHTATHYLPGYENDVGNYLVPIILYHPTVKLPAVNTEMVAQHIDILPTILDFLGVEPPEKNYMGSSLFIEGDKVAANFIDGRYLLYAQDYYLRWLVGEQEPHMFEIADREGKREIFNSRKTELVLKLKAFIQYYNEGMWDNRFYYPTKNQSSN